MPEVEVEASPTKICATKEFIETESSYVRRLMTAYKIYWLGSQSLLHESEHTKIFSNLEEIVLANDNFLQDLLAWETSNSADKSLADIFLNHISKFSVYIVYCRGQQAALQFLQGKLLEPSFSAFLKECTATPECNGLDLGSFLLEPVQRIARYPLLLRHIQKYTETESNENTVLALAIAESEDLLNRLNVAMAEAENEIKVLNIQRRLSQSRTNYHVRPVLSFDHAWKSTFLDHRVLPTDFSGLTRALGARQLLKSGLWIKLKSRRKVLAFLFSDFLLFAEASSGPTSLSSLEDEAVQLKMYRNPIPLDEIWMIKEGPPALCPHSITNSSEYRILELEAHNCDPLLVHIPVSEFEKWRTTIESAKRALKYQTSFEPVASKSCGTLTLNIMSATGIPQTSESTSYCRISLEGTDRTLQTDKAAGGSPQWNETYTLEVPSSACALKIELLRSESLEVAQSLAEFTISSDFFNDFDGCEIVPLQPNVARFPAITLLARMKFERKR